MKARIGLTKELRNAVEREVYSRVHEELAKGSTDIICRGIDIAFLAIARVSNVSPKTIQKAKVEIEDHIMEEWCHYYKETGVDMIKGYKTQMDTCCDTWLQGQLERYGYPYFKPKSEM